MRDRPQCQRQAPRQADDPVTFATKRTVAEAIEPRQQEATDLASHKEGSLEKEPPIT